MKWVAAGTVLGTMAAQGAFQIGFQADTGSTVTFAPAGPGAGTFAFSQADGSFVPQPYQWYGGASAQYVGSIVGSGAGGSFGFNNIQTALDGSQTATITTGGQLTISTWDYTALTGTILGGNIGWSQIETGYGYAGSIGQATFTVDLSNLHYTGSDPELTFLAANNGYLQVAFQFNPGESLTTLASVGGSTSYNGTIYTPAPETSTTVAGFAALGMVGLLVVLQNRRSVAA
jgi:hypothetical protein